MARSNPKDWKNEDVSMDDFGGSRPALKAETIKPANATVVTVTDVEKVEVADADRDDGKRVSLVLQVDEYPDRGFWLNKSGIKTLMEQCGPKPSNWVGQRIPLVVVRVNNPRTGSIQPSLQVASPEEWDDVLAAFDGTSKRRAKTTAKKAARRSK